VYGGVRVFSTGDEIGRRKEYGKEIDEKSYFQLLAQDVIRSFFPKVQDSNKTIWIMREISSHLSVEDVKNLSKAMGEKEEVENKLDAAEDFFKQNNISIPKTEEEMDKILKRYGKMPEKQEKELSNCFHCGATVEPGTNFCDQCGHKI
jgi:rRNA maturation endonuclease Nob1